MVPLPVVPAPLPPAHPGSKDDHERLLRTLDGAA
jgi:hypothetical protein